MRYVTRNKYNRRKLIDVTILVKNMLRNAYHRCISFDLGKKRDDREIKKSAQRRASYRPISFWGNNAVSSGRDIPTFRRSVLPQST
jgi:hypothetical protein